jgi:hypothetical protein
VLLMFTSTCLAQGGPELDALLDAFFAKDLNAVMIHLPLELAKAVASGAPEVQRRVAEAFLIRQQAERQGVKFIRPDSGPVLVVEEPSHGQEESEPKRSELYLDKRMTDGNETMLHFRAKSPYETDRSQTITVWMRYVEGQWRVYEIEFTRDGLKLDDPKLLEKGEASREAANEASAVGSLRTLNTAVITYAATYQDIGAPAAISALAGEGGSADRAGLIEPVLGAPPYEKSGYRFTYIVHNAREMQYTITARPVEAGGTGTRSFFTDQTGVIRYTQEDREPTVSDPPLE